MTGRVLSATAALMLIASFGKAQIFDWHVNVIGRGMLTTSSRIYPHPDAPSFDLRVRNTPFSSGYGGGVEIRLRRLDDNYFFYLSGEYLSQSQTDFKFYGPLDPPRQVPIEEGYVVVPIEAGGQVYIPIGSPTWRLSMGGGVGIYLAEQLLNVAGVRASPVGTSAGFGIHVGVNLEYALQPGVSVIGGVKFRDPEVDVLNRFESTTTVYNNRTLRLPSGEFRSRINVDGMTLQLGIVVEIT